MQDLVCGPRTGRFDKETFAAFVKTWHGLIQDFVHEPKNWTFLAKPCLFHAFIEDFLQRFKIDLFGLLSVSIS